MGRPVKNNCAYFPHDSDMRNHRKVKAIRTTFKNGYAIWSMLLEYLTHADGNEFENSDIEFELLAGDFGFPMSEIREVVDYCIKLEMLFNKNGFIYSESLNEKLAPVYEKRGKARESSKQQLRKNGKFVIKNTDTSELQTSETPQSRVDKSIVDNIKVIVDFMNKELGTGYKPTSKEVKKYISARIGEGFCADDLCLVVQYQNKLWSKDPKMNEYLRPSTLFNSAKFEGYLNNARKNGTATPKMIQTETHGLLNELTYNQLKQKGEI